MYKTQLRGKHSGTTKQVILITYHNPRDFEKRGATLCSLPKLALSPRPANALVWMQNMQNIPNVA